MFKHYVALDWAMKNMAIARMTEKSNQIQEVIDIPANIKDLQLYLKNLKGTISLTFEETTTAQWLYTELYDYVDRINICDPYRNKLLSEGAKTDKIDAKKLVQLLKFDLIKEVFHTGHDFIEFRKLVSGYEDLIKRGVRLKNQRSALFRAIHKNHKSEEKLEGDASNFVLLGLDEGIEAYEKERGRYVKEFGRLKKKHLIIKYLSAIPGLADISAIKIVARVVDAHRFHSRNHFLSYSGLIKLERMSGGKSYGKKMPRFCPVLKSVFKTATLAAMDGDNEFGNYYKYLIEEKKYSERDAKSATSRRIATVVYGVMKRNEKYDPFKQRKNIEKNKKEM